MNLSRSHLFIAALGTVVCLAASTASAGSYDIKEYTPEVQAALSGRQGRYAQLVAAKAAGSVGENKEGLVAQLGGGTDIGGLVAAENNDRMVIYKAIVQQNNLPNDALVTVQQVFADVQRNKASAGDPIQLASGEWTKK